MSKLFNDIRKNLLKEVFGSKRLFIIAICVFLFGLIGNAYGFLDFNFSHDSSMMIQSDGLWQVMIGRYLQPIYVIFRGKLYMCPVVSYVRYFNKFFNKNLPVEESDYLSLKNIKDIQEILDFISKPTPFCRFCNISARTYDNKWERSKLDIAEWT